MWRMSAEVADFYAVEIDAARRGRSDMGMIEDVRDLFAATDEIRGSDEDE